MNFENLQQWIFPALVVTYVGYRLLKAQQVKKVLPEMLAKGAVVVDVRSAAEFQQGARPGSLNIPLGELDSRCRELNKSQQIILCCASGSRSAMAAGILRKNGFTKVFNAGSWTSTVL